ncbi:MAG: hypothetical protein ABH845_02790 [Candidatus Omnitrophota bacterium]
MKGLANALLVAAALCVVIGIISRLSLQPVIGIEAHAFLDLAQTCLLAVIALSVLKK